MKRLLVSIFVVVMLVTLGVLFGAAKANAADIPCPIYGDANGDHAVNMGDVTCIERQILGLLPLTPGADANMNGAVSIGDVVWVERQILGLAPVYGDANGNGVVDQADITYAEHAILGLVPITPGCDANQNGALSIGDIAVIGNMLN